VTFGWPAALWMLALWPLLAAGYALAARARARRGLVHTGVLWLPAAGGDRGPLLWFVGAGLLATVAAARPEGPWPVPNRWPVVLVVDVSRSMEETDVTPSRIAAAKRAASEFVRRLPQGVRVGVVSFGSSATVVVPLTHDRRRVLEGIAGLATELRTQLGAGLLAALHLLEAEPPHDPRGVVVLLSDGRYSDGPTPESAAERAAQLRVRVYTVGIATTRPAYLLRSGYWGLLDENTLRLVAERTGGTYARTTRAAELRRAYRDLARTVGWAWRREEVGGLFALLAAVALVGAAAASVRRNHPMAS
jgi:Ca-activated chloride channel family protein